MEALGAYLSAADLKRSNLGKKKKAGSKRMEGQKSKKVKERGETIHHKKRTTERGEKGTKTGTWNNSIYHISVCNVSL